MIKFKRLTIALAALLIASATAWAQTEQTVAVTPVTGQTNQWTLTMPAGNVTLNVEYEPEFTATFKALTANTIEGGKATLKLDDATATLTDGKLTPVYEGQTITLTAQQGYKFRSVTAAKKGAASNIVNPQVGQIIGSDGKNYAADATLPSGVTAVAMIAYVGNESDCTNGLAIALADESGSQTWSAAGTACSQKTAVTGCTWRLPSQNQWKAMFKANGGNESSYNGLNTAITNVGGTALQEDGYWSSTESGEVAAYSVYLYNGEASFSAGYKDGEGLVRACLAF